MKQKSDISHIEVDANWELNGPISPPKWKGESEAYQIVYYTLPKVWVQMIGK